MHPFCCAVADLSAVDAAGAVAGADLIVTSLPRSVDVEALADTLIEANALQPDAVWLDCTSGVPDVTQRIYAKLADVDVHFLDCGVAGGPAGAEAGSLAAMVGGDAEALATVRCPASATCAQTLTDPIAVAGGTGDGALDGQSGALRAVRGGARCQEREQLPARSAHLGGVRGPPRRHAAVRLINDHET